MTSGPAATTATRFWICASGAAMTEYLPKHSGERDNERTAPMAEIDVAFGDAIDILVYNARETVDQAKTRLRRHGWSESEIWVPQRMLDAALNEILR
jgi:hypothetical protein